MVFNQFYSNSDNIDGLMSMCRRLVIMGDESQFEYRLLFVREAHIIACYSHHCFVEFFSRVIFPILVIMVQSIVGAVLLLAAVFSARSIWEKKTIKKIPNENEIMMVVGACKPFCWKARQFVCVIRAKKDCSKKSGQWWM